MIRIIQDMFMISVFNIPYPVLTIVYVALDAYGLHFDGVSFLVYAFLNGYLVFVCWAGWLIYAKKKDKVSKFAD